MSANWRLIGFESMKSYSYKYLISISSLKVYNCKIVASVSYSVSQFALVIVIAMQCCEATTTTVNRRQQSGAFEKKSPLTFTTGFNQEIQIFSRKDFSCMYIQRVQGRGKNEKSNNKSELKTTKWCFGKKSLLSLPLLASSTKQFDICQERFKFCLRDLLRFLQL